MYDINTKVIKKGYKFFFIFLAAGIIFGVILGAVLISNKKKADSMDASVMSFRVEVRTSENSDGDTMYSPTYYYRVDGTEYSCPSNSSSSVYPSEDNKLVYYDSKNPSKCVNSYSLNTNKILLLVMLIPVIFIVIAVLNMVKVSKRVKLVQELNERGKLVKNLPYRLEDTGTVVNNVPIQRIVVDYKLPSGTTLTLKGDPRYDKKTGDADGMVDLVIDENNPDNYFIDFEINRLTGNTPSDYYQGNTNPAMQPQIVNGVVVDPSQVQATQTPVQGVPVQEVPVQTPPVAPTLETPNYMGQATTEGQNQYPNNNGTNI